MGQFFLAVIMAAIAYTGVIMMSIITITITTTLTTTIATVKIQLVCINPFVAVGVWVQPVRSEGQL